MPWSQSHTPAMGSQCMFIIQGKSVTDETEAPALENITDPSNHRGFKGFAEFHKHSLYFSHILSPLHQQLANLRSEKMVLRYSERQVGEAGGRFLSILAY